MIGGIIMLFTPMDIDTKKTAHSGSSSTGGTNKASTANKTKKATATQSQSQSKEEDIVVQKFATSEEDREQMAGQLRDLKLKIDQHTANETEKEKFEILLADYREKYPKTGQ